MGGTLGICGRDPALVGEARTRHGGLRVGLPSVNGLSVESCMKIVSTWDILEGRREALSRTLKEKYRDELDSPNGLVRRNASRRIEKEIRAELRKYIKANRSMRYKGFLRFPWVN